jgi:murein DD-endopeptidase MepM/ murein hydrolase activator NlpD
MVRKKEWQFLVTNGTSNAVKSFKYSHRTVIVVLVVVMILLIASAAIAVLFFTNEVDRNELRKLQLHNAQLNSEMGKMDSLLDSIQMKLEELEEKEKKMRELNSMRPIDEQVRQMGVGGIKFVDSTFYYIDTTLFRLHNDVLNKLELVSRKLDFESQNYDEVIDYLEVKDLVFQHTPSIWPAPGRITDRYGYRIHPIKKYYHFHHGIDIANKLGTPVYTTANGRVIETGYTRDYGYYVLIDHRYGYSTFYAHLNKIYVHRNESVTKYQIIAEIGNSGSSTGPHLHYEVRRYGRSVNPISYLDKEKSSFVLDNSQYNLVRQNGGG